ncbi:MAG: hypothetical protein ABFS43_05940 [Thermodesulfobacteriota bacterium]
MKITMPENLETPFAMLMKGLPEEIQSDKAFKNAVLVFLKLGGVSIARQYVETRARYQNYDPLEIDTGFRFPRLQENDAEEGSKDEENGTEDDENDENDENEQDDDTSPEDKAD